MDINIKKRLTDIDAQIKLLQEELEKLRTEKYELIQVWDKNVICKIPSSARNALKRLNIETDSDLIRLIDGEFTDEYILKKPQYKKANSRVERLMSVRGIGAKIANEVAQILTENNL